MKRYGENNFSWPAGCAAGAICVSAFFSSCSIAPVPSSTVTHVVLLWMKHPERSADRAQLTNASRTLRMVPGVLRVEIGRAVPAPPPDIDRSFDLGVVIMFRDRVALERCENDPRHHDALRRYLQPLVRRYVVYNVGDR